jgi:acetyltransferase-like isoleucine patch superfamily enzyme
MKIVIVGSGAVAAELTSYIKDHNRQVQQKDQLLILGYLDSSENIETYWKKYKLEKPVLGDVHGYSIKKDENFIIAISNIEFRLKMIDILSSRRASVIGFIHASAIIAESATLGSGNIIYPHCIVGPNVKMGDHNLLTAYSFVSHDCIVGSHNFFSSSGLSGNTIIGNSNYFGIRSTVLPNISIGDNNTIQAGMIVDKNVLDNSMVFHRFKEKVIAIKNHSSNE